MKLEDKKVILKKIRHLPDQIDDYTIYSYKKDRCLKVHTQRTEKGSTYILQEEGFQHQTYFFDEKKEFHKKLKKLIELEFPRSRKLYINKRF